MELEQIINGQYYGPGNPTELALQAVMEIVRSEAKIGDAIAIITVATTGRMET